MDAFKQWDDAFRRQDLYSFNHNPEGILWLKVRAVTRNQLMNNFLEIIGLELTATKVEDRKRELFNWLLEHPEQVAALNQFLNDRNNELYRKAGVDEKKLKEDLQRVQSYEWGGDQNNNLDRYLIGRYVKPISSYDALCSKQAEISHNSWNFVQTSWYNNWTSYMIESQFKKHPRALSAVGEIKSVDFFVDDIPFDLKVTYFPKEFLDDKVKETLGAKSLSWLRKKAKRNKIIVSRDLSETEQMRILRERLSLTYPDIIRQLDDTYRSIICQAQQQPDELIKWLYEKQSSRLFGAENRLFLIMADITNMEESWKMKRAFDLISPKVKDYMDNFSEKNLKDVHFTFEGRLYHCLADIIFIVKA